MRRSSLRTGWRWRRTRHCSASLTSHAALASKASATRRLSSWRRRRRRPSGGSRRCANGSSRRRGFLRKRASTKRKRGEASAGHSAMQLRGNPFCDLLTNVAPPAASHSRRRCARDTGRMRLGSALDHLHTRSPPRHRAHCTHILARCRAHTTVHHAHDSSHSARTRPQDWPGAPELPPALHARSALGREQTRAAC